MGYFLNSSRFPYNASGSAVSRQAGVQLLESEKIKEKDHRKGQGTGRLRFQALILVLSFVLPFCSPRIAPSGFSGWFEVSGPEGRGKGKFYFREGGFLRIEFMGCSFNFRKGNVFVFDRRRREVWKGKFDEVKSRFPYLPTLNEMETLWKGKSLRGFKVIDRDKQGRARVIEVDDSTIIRILKVRHGATLDFPSDYRRVSLERICSRLVPAQN